MNKVEREQAERPLSRLVGGMLLMLALLVLVMQPRH